jgi:hypothetical protein
MSQAVRGSVQGAGIKRPALCCGKNLHVHCLFLDCCLSAVSKNTRAEKRVCLSVDITLNYFSLNSDMSRIRNSYDLERFIRENCPVAIPPSANFEYLTNAMEEVKTI